jgi:hypothetical protein
MASGTHRRQVPARAGGWHRMASGTHRRQDRVRAPTLRTRLWVSRRFQPCWRAAGESSDTGPGGPRVFSGCSSGRCRCSCGRSRGRRDRGSFPRWLPARVSSCGSALSPAPPHPGRTITRLLRLRQARRNRLHRSRRRQRPPRSLHLRNRRRLPLRNLSQPNRHHPRPQHRVLRQPQAHLNRTRPSPLWPRCQSRPRRR